MSVHGAASIRNGGITVASDMPDATARTADAKAVACRGRKIMIARQLAVAAEPVAGI